MDMEKIKKLNIPKSSGCYQFLDKNGKILYIGKAVNLNSRVSSYWRHGATRSFAKHSMLKKITKINLIKTESEIEALLLESNLIKKHQPPYNIIMRDDKRYQYIKITGDELPRITTTRDIDKSGRYFGPFTSGMAVRETIKAIGKIFPYGKFATMPKNKTNETKMKRYPELYRAPENVSNYKKMIKQIIKFLEGDMKSVERNLKLEIRDLEKTLLSFPRKRESSSNATNNVSGSPIPVEDDTKDIISALKYRLLNMKNVLAHANVLSIYDKYVADVIELSKTLGLARIPKRIEGYDISNIFGKEAVGSMVVFKNGESDKKEYRKFKIKGSHCEEPKRRNNLVSTGNNEIACLSDRQASSSLLAPSRNDKKSGDTAMLKEILERRFNNDWPLPDLIIIDGGKGQLNAGIIILKKFKLNIPIISISKGEGLRSAKAPDKIFFPGEKQALKLPLASPALHIIKRVRDEAHRFAINYHKQKRSKTLKMSL